jgi:hypothetical protein
MTNSHTLQPSQVPSLLLRKIRISKLARPSRLARSIEAVAAEVDVARVGRVCLKLELGYTRRSRDGVDASIVAIEIDW